jgi:hypothetical protein
MSELLSKNFGVVGVSQLPHNIWRIELQPGEELDVKDVIPLVEWVKDNAPELPYKLMLVGGYGSTISPDVQVFMADPDRRSRVSREAFVIQSFAHRLIANFYIRYRKPEIPTKIFQTEEEAEKWLSEV